MFDNTYPENFQFFVEFGVVPWSVAVNVVIYFYEFQHLNHPADVKQGLDLTKETGKFSY